VLVCSRCARENPDDARFCNACGAALAPEPRAREERKIVTAVFVDLVGSTARAERLDPEDVRAMLRRYHETLRRELERYGGTVEKFIGDAVMALWGAPVAHEDDAERAVRAALDLVGAIPTLDASLRVRAGVLSGEAAVTLGAEGQGMVAGDLVNTASRIQSAAEPGTVLVGDATKRASEASIAYDDAGEHVLKGKAEARRLWRALRVVAGARGSLRSSGLEAPFVGRDRELRLVKEHFHASADEGRAQLVLVNGIPGIGKSRLAWEFEKYVDGLAGETFWHRGRCLSYGDGVAYWALAEMVRMRCGIAEEEEPSGAREKLDLALSEYILDADERAWVEPRLQQAPSVELRIHGAQQVWPEAAVLRQVHPPARRRDDLVQSVQQPYKAVAADRDVECERPAGHGERDQPLFGAEALEHAEERCAARRRNRLERDAHRLLLAERHDELVLHESVGSVEAVPRVDAVERVEERVQRDDAAA